MSKSIGFVYSLTHKNRNDTPLYIGSTNCLKSRFDAHRYACNNNKQIKYNYYVYQFIRDYGGIENWKINKLAELVFEKKEELIKLERMFIDKYTTDNIKLLNKILPQRTKKEYQEYYKPLQKIANIKSRIKNREKHNEKRKEHYHKNKERILKHNTEYYHKNKEKVDKIRQEKVSCICGEVISRKHRKTHLKSDKHHNNLLSTLKEKVNLIL